MSGTVNILGTEYSIGDLPQKEYEICDGVAYEYSKTILIKRMRDMLSDCDSNSEKQARYNEVLRHEIIHMFFAESGLNQYCADEVLVDWIAKQFPKLLETFSSKGCET